MRKLKELTNYIIHPEESVINAMSILDKGGKRIAFVVDEDNHLLGTFTDGDNRRFILHGGDLRVPVRCVMNAKFTSVFSENEEDAESLMETYDLTAVPVLDHDQKLVSIAFSDNTQIITPIALKTPVVIMAGGKGTRLYPYTKVLPKPLIPINDTPISVLIMQHFAAYGLTDFLMIVNHQKNLIKAFFNDSEFGYKVSFADEDTPLGTGGGLKLIQDQIDDTFFLTNCDILVDADYGKMLKFHKEKGNLITMVCATKRVDIPYGTVVLNDSGFISGITEKPSYSFLTNTGMYLLEPEVFDYIPDVRYRPMTDIILDIVHAGGKTGVFPITSGQWSDMGELPGMEAMMEHKEIA